MCTWAGQAGVEARLVRRSPVPHDVEQSSPEEGREARPEQRAAAEQSPDLADGSIARSHAVDASGQVAHHAPAVGGHQDRLWLQVCVIARDQIREALAIAPEPVDGFPHVTRLEADATNRLAIGGCVGSDLEFGHRAPEACRGSPWLARAGHL